MADLYKVGRIVNTQGLKGEIRIFPSTDYKEQFEDFETLYIKSEKIKVEIEKIRYKGELIIAKFKGLSNINDVEKYKNEEVFIDRDELEDVVFNEDMIGMKVVCEINGELGILNDVLVNPTQDVYVINSERFGKEILIPVVDEFVLEVNFETEEITVRLIEGMI